MQEKKNYLMIFFISKFLFLVNFTMVHDEPIETVNNTLAVRYRAISSIIDPELLVDRTGTIIVKKYAYTSEITFLAL